jgi:transglutaminase-like putative cysteine protease
MRFQVTHKLMTYLLVLSALATLGAAGLLTVEAAAATLVLGGLSWFFDPGTAAARLLARGVLVLRVLATGFFAWTAYEVWTRLPEPDLSPVLNFVLFLVVYKLFQRAANRDYLQVYVLSFLLVLAAAAFAQSFVFAIAFAAYVVLTTWTLMLLHLRREMEDNYLVKHSGQTHSHKVGVARILNSRRVVGVPFLLATGGVALAVSLGSALTFAMIPRIGAGFVFGGPRARRNLIGFSDEVTLGNAGFLSADNQTVALRATLPRLTRLSSNGAREAEVDRFYWRGTVYDTYLDGRWTRSRTPALRSTLQDLGRIQLLREPHLQPVEAVKVPFPPLEGTERQEIDIVGVSVPVAFALDQPVAFELPPPKVGTLAEVRLDPRFSGEVAFQGPGTEIPTEAGPDGSGELRAFAGTHYVAYSRDPLSFSTARRGRPLAEVPHELVAPYLAMPPDLSPRVAELARKITAGKATPAAKMLAITDWLQATHGYSTDVRPADKGRDPVEQFLFERNAGHCEYFATAAALMLRAVGVPTRYVNGFLGGEWNDIGHYVTVRQNRAHAWVEAYLGQWGWMRVDATPPLRPVGRMSKLRQLLDSLEFFWSRWVVGYDLGRQIELARTLGRGVGVAPAHTAEPRGAWPWRPILIRVGILVVLLGVFVVLRRRRAARAPGATLPVQATQAVGRLYRRSIERLRLRGYERHPFETPTEFATRLGRANIRGAEVFATLTEFYVQARFGRRQIPDDLVAELGRRLGELGLPQRGDTSQRAA